MHDQPEGAGLLAIARQTLLNELLPQLAAEHRYTALMIASALNIASREFGESPAAARPAQLSTLPEVGDITDQRLCEQLRNGELDHRLDELAGTVRENIEARLRISNPKLLEGAGASPGKEPNPCPS
jgi:hypothetical protein